MKVLYHAVFMSYYHASTTCSFLYLDLVVSCLDSRHAVLKHVMIFMKYGMHAIFKIPFITCSSQALYTTQFSYHIVSATWRYLYHAISKHYADTKHAFPYDMPFWFHARHLSYMQWQSLNRAHVQLLIVPIMYIIYTMQEHRVLNLTCNFIITLPSK